ncbi:MAG: hypothetical protein IPG50_37555 [Myxococcales bacterium]|nr:hypothetical protein [Myxococcales bacterium]
MAALIVPNLASVLKLLGGLLGKPVTAKPATAPLAVAPARAIATYQDAEGHLLAVCVCDVACAAYVGAALSLLAPAVAAEAHKKGKIPESIMENFHEVVNVAASLFNVTGGGHVRLEKILVTPCDVPAPVASLVAKPKTRLDLDVTVPGYGTGKMSFVVLEAQ